MRSHGRDRRRRQVAAVVGEENAQRCAAILVTGAHRAAGLETKRLLSTDKWHTTAEKLTESLVRDGRRG